MSFLWPSIWWPVPTISLDAQVFCLAIACSINQKTHLSGGFLSETAISHPQRIGTCLLLAMEMRKCTSYPLLLTGYNPMAYNNLEHFQSWTFHWHYFSTLQALCHPFDSSFFIVLGAQLSMLLGKE